MTGCLDEVLVGLEAHRPASADESPATASVSRARAALDRTRDAVNANPRVRRHRDEIARAEVQLQVYEHLVDACHLIGRLPPTRAGDPPPVHEAAARALEALRRLVSAPDLGLETGEQPTVPLADLDRAGAALDQTLGAHAQQQWLRPVGVLLAVTGTQQILRAELDRPRTSVSRAGPP